MRYLGIALVVLLCFLVTGCDGGSKNLVKPEETTISQYQDFNVEEYLEKHNAVMQTVSIKGEPKQCWVNPEVEANAASYLKVLYICDGPLIGPQLEGHCAYDGSNCSGLPGSWDPDRWITTAEPVREWSPTPQKGDPTADDAQQPGDADETVVR